MDLIKLQEINCFVIASHEFDTRIYDGFINVLGHDYEFSVRVKPPSDDVVVAEDEGEDKPLSNATLLYDCELSSKLGHRLNALIANRLTTCASVVEFFAEFVAIVENRLRSSSDLVTHSDDNLFHTIIHQLQLIGYDKIDDIDVGFKWVDFIVTDSHNRDHTIRIKLTDNFPTNTPECLTNLPKHFAFNRNTEISFTSLLSQFEEKLECYQSFWNVADCIDTSAWVLDPETPSRSTTYRRVAIGGNTSILINIIPEHPNILPDIKILGSDHSCKPIREAYANNCYSWDENVNFIENLETLLGIKLPKKSEVKKEDLFTACSVCYSISLGEHLPEESCVGCRQIFHSVCLYEWLKSLHSTQKSFNLLFGECPYCSKRISIKIPKTA